MAEYWTDAYVGRKHIDGVYDCVSLVCDALKEHYGRVVRLPESRVKYEHGNNYNEIIDYYTFNLCERTQTPVDGDVVLMYTTKTRLDHIGLYVELPGGPYVLHSMVGYGTCLHKLSKLSKYTLKVEGFYRVKDEKENDADRYVAAPASSGG